MKNENEYIVRHITVTHCSHSDYSPPERVGNRLEEGAFRARFGKVDSTGEENDTCNKLQRMLPHITIAHGRHRHDGPPEGVRNRLEEGLVGTCFCEVHRR
ncbi:hypothetical protein RUM43_002849 [Polyplax serrata]|uniref:Uncharacterized protein n=1 Tax=Polyplax serrata TaxID=468196 RepID=A0AAN8S554_POLSC